MSDYKSKIKRRKDIEEYLESKEQPENRFGKNSYITAMFAKHLDLDSIKTCQKIDSNFPYNTHLLYTYRTFEAGFNAGRYIESCIMIE